MLYRSVLTTAVALVGVTSAAPSGSADDTCRLSALNILLGRCNNLLLPFGCHGELKSQAKSFCSTYLTPKTVSKTASATTTQVLFFTNTATASTTATATSTSTTVTVATATDQATETATTLTGTITTTSWIPPTSAPAPPADRRRGLWPIGCPEFNTALFLAQGPAQASSLCTFLGVKPRTTTVTSTKTSTTKTSTTATVTTTTATTTTDVTVETALSLTTTTSVTTTTTADVAVATQTLVDYCTGAATYNPAITGDQTGTTSQVTTATDAIDCCRKCWLGVNCIGSIFSGANCIQLIITAALDGTPATPMCPLGADDDYIFTPGPGPIYLGPCAAQSQ